MAGGSRFCMSLQNECSIDSHTRSREVGKYLPGRVGEVGLVMLDLDPILPLSEFFQPVLSVNIV